MIRAKDKSVLRDRCEKYFYVNIFELGATESAIAFCIIERIGEMIRKSLLYRMISRGFVLTAVGQLPSTVGGADINWRRYSKGK